MDEDEARARLAELDKRAERLKYPPAWVWPALVVLVGFIAWALLR